MYNVNDCNNILINKNKNIINMIKLGYVINNTNDCFLLDILTHCKENEEIFNNKQLDNINECINKLCYG